MNKNGYIRCASICMPLFLLAPFASSAQTTPGLAQTQDRDRERIYGSQLMTDQERNAYRERMRQASSEKDREQIRSQHHEQMKQRAAERGVKIPDEPPPRGMGYGREGGFGGRGGPGGGGGGQGR